MANTDRLAGFAGLINLGGNALPLTSANPKFDPDLVESTDSSDYDPTTGMLWETQLPAKMKGTIDFEANFSLANTNANLFPLLYSPNPVEANVYVNRTRKLYDGNWNLKNLDITVPVKEPGMVTVKGQLMSNGVITVS